MSIAQKVALVRTAVPAWGLRPALAAVGLARATWYYFLCRRRGYAEQAMLALEKEARRMGAGTIRLHVFGHNSAARPLYEKLGYYPTNIVMAKDLA